MSLLKKAAANRKLGVCGVWALPTPHIHRSRSRMEAFFSAVVHEICVIRVLSSKPKDKMVVYFFPYNRLFWFHR
jgi:hypothetical protein